MPVHRTAIEGLLVLNWDMHHDERGYFKQTYQHGELAQALCREPRLRQGNHSRSQARVLRGFHIEPWDKLIYVPRGLATCVVADVRPDSPTFGATEHFLLGDSPGRLDRVFIHRGLANAFYSHAETDYLNDVSEEYNPTGRGGVVWNDPHLNVPWPDTNPILSEADRQHPTLKALFPSHPFLA
ncbi:dTDP-4-dehydrorhamnose 3,5-epimerase family protein [Ottowia thiooxydans]|uniref:dTDP-4-dehydrorhamnose 3,5-epimerase family protein n=1 Tax=Ottowia thiooxydans TaxID=219182 RepID=UPI000423DFC9|nr:dTDP-4-dehydrorhamnose 3,5-epimerase family protein [Ottowia thiooxydans]